VKAPSVKGVRVAICGRSQESVERAVAEMAPLGSVYGRQADIRRVDDVREYFGWVEDKLGGLDILVNNAGRGGIPQGRGDAGGGVAPQHRSESERGLLLFA